MSDFEHFIITQFNVKFRWSGWNGVRDVPSKDWFDYRINLFRKYTYPAMVNQINQNFKWLVFFDDSTNRDSISEFKRITPIYLKDYTRWLPKHISDAILSHSSESSWIISSILDSDDVYHPMMVSDIQSNFEPREFMIDFKDGINFNIHNGKSTLYKYKSPSPYISIVEPKTKKLKTCKLVQHPGMRKHFREKSISNVIRWAMIIHGSNVNNKMRGRPCRDKKVLKSFKVLV